MKLYDLHQAIREATHELAQNHDCKPWNAEVVVDGLQLESAELNFGYKPCLCITSHSRVLNLPISVLELTPRAIRCLDEHITTLKDLMAVGFIGLISQKGCGVVTVKEIEAKLNKWWFGLWGYPTGKTWKSEKFYLQERQGVGLTKVVKRYRRFGTIKAFDILALLQNSGLTYRGIAKKHEVSRQRVHQIAAQAVSAGIQLPERKVGRRKRER